MLCGQLAEWIERRNDRDGLRATRIGPAERPRPRAADIEETTKPATDKPPGHFGPVMVSETEYFVSYAWGDATRKGGHATM